MSAIPHLDAGSADARTGDHLAGVVDDALVVLVRAMGEVHADWSADSGSERALKADECARFLRRTDVDSRAHQLAELLGGVDLGTCSTTMHSATMPARLQARNAYRWSR